MRGSPPPALQPRPPSPAAAPLGLSHHWVLPGKAPPAARNLPYPGCRWVQCLAGAWALWAGRALSKGSRGRSSPAHCAVAPAAGSPRPLSLLPALLPLWGHGSAASYNPHPAWKTGPLPPEPWDTWQETCAEAAAGPAGASLEQSHGRGQAGTGGKPLPLQVDTGGGGSLAGVTVCLTQHRPPAPSNTVTGL